MKTPTNKRRGLAAVLGFAAFAAVLPSVADDYQFIVSGDPVAAATADTSSCATEGVALLTGTLTASVMSPEFDIRSWTLFETLGVKLNTWPLRGGLFIIR